MAVLTTPNVPDIRRLLASSRPELSEDSVTFRAGVLLLVGQAASFNVDRMAWRTQIPRAVVAACARRLFDNGVWHPDGALYSWRSPDEDQFWLDVSVAEGQLCRRTDPLGRIEWAAPGAWRKSYEFNDEAPSSLSVSYSRQVAAPAPSPEPASEQPAAELSANEAASAASSPKDTLRKARRRKPAVSLAGPAESESPWLGVTVPRQELFPGTAWLG